MIPGPALQVAILADLCDAVDPALDQAARGDAAQSAYDSSPEFAFAAMAGLTVRLMRAISENVSADAAADVMRDLRCWSGQFSGISETEAP